MAFEPKVSENDIGAPKKVINNFRAIKSFPPNIALCKDFSPLLHLISVLCFI